MGPHVVAQEHVKETLLAVSATVAQSVNIRDVPLFIPEQTLQAR